MSGPATLLVIPKMWISMCRREYMILVCSLNRFQSYMWLQIYKYIHRWSFSTFHPAPHLPTLHITSCISSYYPQVLLPFVFNSPALLQFSRITGNSSSHSILSLLIYHSLPSKFSVCLSEEEATEPIWASQSAVVTVIWECPFQIW